MLFPIAIHKDQDSDYGVTVPDLPGCFSAGRTLEEAIANAREAIELHLEEMMEAGEVAAPLDMARHRDNPDFAAAFVWALVEINLDKLRGAAQRVNITIPERWLGKIDHAAKAAGASRSEYLVSAALRQAGATYLPVTAVHPRTSLSVKVPAAGLGSMKVGRRESSSGQFFGTTLGKQKGRPAGKKRPVRKAR